MHEYSIVQALVDRVEAEAHARGATAVRRLAVRIGELSGVEPELLATAYLVFRERSVCHDAALDIRRVPARWVCSACGQPLARGDVLRCPACASPGRLDEGDEIILDRIEMEVP